MKTKIFSREKIRSIRTDCRDGEVSKDDILVLADMAEKHRRQERARQRKKNQQPKLYLKSTDWLSVDQFTQIMSVVTREADAARANTASLTRAVRNEMIIILLAETGIRAAELLGLRIKHLPWHHGKDEIEVKGKGSKYRTVGISSWLRGRLDDYCAKYHRRSGLESRLFSGERGGALSYRGLYAKIKKIGVKAGVWLYRSKGKITTRLSPHKFRHTYATLLLNVSDNEFLVQSQLGHERPDTTMIYARTLDAKRRRAMDQFHGRLFGQILLGTGSEDVIK